MLRRCRLAAVHVDNPGGRRTKQRLANAAIEREISHQLAVGISGQDAAPLERLATVRVPRLTIESDISGPRSLREHRSHADQPSI